MPALNPQPLPAQGKMYADQLERGDFILLDGRWHYVSGIRRIDGKGVNLPAGKQRTRTQVTIHFADRDPLTVPITQEFQWRGPAKSQAR